MVVTNNAEPTS